MHIETDATQHLRHAATKARAASHILARLPDADRNAVILRGGSESQRSAQAINAALAAGLRAVGLPEGCVQIAPDADRAYVAAMLAAAGLLDLIVPRGGRSLVERVQREARVPVLAHAEGLCHTYVHASADHAM